MSAHPIAFRTQLWAALSASVTLLGTPLLSVAAPPPAAGSPAAAAAPSGPAQGGGRPPAAPVPEAAPHPSAGDARDGKATADADTSKTPAVARRFEQVTATLTVKVVHPDEARKAAVARAVAVGGYAKLITDTELHLEVPDDKLQETLDGLAAAGIVLHKGLQRFDRTQEIAQLDARLRSKREILGRLRSFFDDADVQSTLRIENSMTQLVQEIEALQGQLQGALHDTSKAHVQVSFQFHPRQVITTVRSPFAWLNSLDIQRFLSDFER
jgi:hypothetical protein